MRKVLHVDLDAFFCSVEEVLNPTLKGKIFATGGSPESRSVITSCTYSARQFGIRSAMPVKTALRIYPKLQIIKGHFHEYQSFSRKVMQLLQSQSPLFEQVSIDEAFLDVTDLPQPLEIIALELQEKILSTVGLPCSIGCASNKLVAKMATNYGKSLKKHSNAPMSIMAIEPGQEAVFLATQPVIALWGVGPKGSSILKGLGINKISDIVEAPFPLLEKYFGKYAEILVRHAMGIDNAPVENIREIKSVSNEHTFSQDITDTQHVICKLRKISENVGYRLRKKGLSGRSVHIKIRWADFKSITRQITLQQPTNNERVIFKVANDLLLNEWSENKPIRLIGVGVSGLVSICYQLSLFNDEDEREQKLFRAIDNLREKYGSAIIKQGAEIEE